MNLMTALEEVTKASSSKKQETEVVVYAKIGNPAGLNDAQDVEDHIQVEGTMTTKSRIRVRKTIKGGLTTNELTLKIKNMDAGLEGNIEYNVPVTDDFLEGFKQAAEKMVVKRRYTFFSKSVKLAKKNPSGEEEIVVFPNVKYEVDVYQKPDGGFSDWCKIDIEINAILDHIKANNLNIDQFKLKVKVSHLPFRPQEPILTWSATEEQHKFLGNLWEMEFNHRLKPVEGT